MKKILMAVLCVCLLWCAAASAEDTEEDGFLLRIWDRSGLEISYLRFDIYAGDEYRGLICSCPDEGEDFYRCPYSPDTQEDAEKLRIECSYGVSDLSPEDAILQVMAGKPAEEHPLLTLDFIPEIGQTYDLDIKPDGNGGWQLAPAEEQHQE